MPNPALSTSYKQRPHVDKVNDGSLEAQSMEGSMHFEKATDLATNSLESRMRPPQSRISSCQSNADGLKRRSLLPQPGQFKYSSHLPDVAPARLEAQIQPTASDRPRPKSIYQTGTSRPQIRDMDDKLTASRSIRPPHSISKPLEPQTTGLDRSRSLRRPNIPNQSIQAAKSISHARTQSTNNVPIARGEMTTTKIAAERPKSLLIAPSSSVKPKAVPADAGATRVSARLAGSSRTDNVKIRSEIPSGGVAARSVLRPEDPVGTQSRRRDVLKEEPTRTARPAFTTLQQHFTPRKIGKAPTSTFLHPPPAPCAKFLPPEIASLQSELLQLHLLHEKSAEVSQQWQVSAKRSLHKKFDEVASLHQTMLDYERAGQEQKNLQALLKWSAETSSAGLIEYVRVLSGPLHELPALLGPGGRFQRLLDEFEGWMLRVEKIRFARLSSTVGHGDLGSIEALGDSWKAENAALIRKVTSFARDFDHLSQPSSESSIVCIVDMCKMLLKGLLSELNIMQAIEADVVDMEKEWVAARLQAIARDVGAYSMNANGELAAWRM